MLTDTRHTGGRGKQAGGMLGDKTFGHKIQHMMSYLMASRACDESRFWIPFLVSASVTSISAIMSSISSLLTRPRYLLGVERRRVGNL